MINCGGLILDNSPEFYATSKSLHIFSMHFLGGDKTFAVKTESDFQLIRFTYHKHISNNVFYVCSHGLNVTHLNFLPILHFNHTLKSLACWQLRSEDQSTCKNSIKFSLEMTVQAAFGIQFERKQQISSSSNKIPLFYKDRQIFRNTPSLTMIKVDIFALPKWGVRLLVVIR